MYSRLVLQSSEQNAPAALLSEESDVKKRRSQLAQYVCRCRHRAPLELPPAAPCLANRRSVCLCPDADTIDTATPLGMAIHVVLADRLAGVGIGLTTQSTCPGQDFNCCCSVRLVRLRKMNGIIRDFMRDVKLAGDTKTSCVW